MASTSEILPPKRVPGDNPNKTNARHRKYNRPKAVSTPLTKSEDMHIKWIEPLTDVDLARLGEIDLMHEFPFAGDFELEDDFISTISMPFQSVFEAAYSRTNVSQQILDNTSNKLEAMAFFKSSRQLFSTMLPQEKSVCQPLKCVFYDDQEIPINMAAIIDTIGHLETRYGKVLLKHAPTQFKRWIVNGLDIDPDSDPNMDFSNASKCIWRDTDGFLLLKEKINEELDLRQRRTFKMNDPTTSTLYDVRIPDIPDSDSAITAYVNALPPNVPALDELKLLLESRIRGFNDFKNSSLTTTSGLLEVDLYTLLNLRIEDVDISVPVLREQFTHCVSNYQTTYLPHIQSIFDVIKPGSSSNGNSSQLISGKNNDLKMNTKLHPSDGDLAVGYAFHPLKHFDFRPSIIGYGRTQPREVVERFATSKTKTLASV